MRFPPRWWNCVLFSISFPAMSPAQTVLNNKSRPPHLQYFLKQPSEDSSGVVHNSVNSDYELCPPYFSNECYVFFSHMIIKLTTFFIIISVEYSIFYWMITNCQISTTDLKTSFKIFLSSNKVHNKYTNQRFAFKYTHTHTWTCASDSETRCKIFIAHKRLPWVPFQLICHAP